MADLRNHFIVKNEIIGIFLKGNFLKHFARIRSKAGMIFGQLLVHKQVLHERQEAIREIFVSRHSAGKRTVSQNAGPKHNGIQSIADNAHHREDETRSVLIIGMQHDDDIGIQIQRLPVAGLLIGAVSAVSFVNDDVPYTECGRNSHGCVVATIVD